MLKLKEVFVDERVNLLVIRDTPEVVRMAERLIADGIDGIITDAVDRLGP